MSLSQLIKPDAVLAALRVNGKKQALQEMSERAALVSGLPARQIFDSILQRERLGSTGVGDGVAIPHGKLPGIKRVFAAFARSPQGVDFQSLDGRPTHLFFLLVAPEDSAGAHLKALARISRLLKNDDFRSRLMQAASARALWDTIREEDARY